MTRNFENEEVLESSLYLKEEIRKKDKIIYNQDLALKAFFVMIGIMFLLEPFAFLLLKKYCNF